MFSGLKVLCSFSAITLIVLVCLFSYEYHEYPAPFNHFVVSLNSFYAVKLIFSKFPVSVLKPKNSLFANLSISL